MSVSTLSIGDSKLQPNAISLHAKPSATYAEKVSESLALLQQAVANFSPVTQASSLGAEDVVISHLINRHALNIPLFVLETGALHRETLALLERTQAHSKVAVKVYRPAHEKVIAFVKTHEGAWQITAGSEGLEAIALNYPRREAPAAANDAVAAKSPQHRVWQCMLCAFTYDEAKGMPDEGVAAGTRWEDVPETWTCPDCSASKSDFQMEVVG